MEVSTRWIKCPACNGTGEENCLECDGDGGPVGDCNECGGSGVQDCPRCEGHGLIDADELEEDGEDNG